MNFDYDRCGEVDFDGTSLYPLTKKLNTEVLNTTVYLVWSSDGYHHDLEMIFMTEQSANCYAASRRAANIGVEYFVMSRSVAR